MIELPPLTTDQMREVERLMVEVYQIMPLQIIENSGYNLALLAKHLLDDDLVDRPVVVLAGRGKKGGGGLAAARHLLNWGAWVQTLLTDAPEQYTGVPAQQLAALQTIGAPLAWAEEGWELPPADLVVDAILDDGDQSELQGRVDALIQLANSSHAPLLSLDAPSGLDMTTGQLATPHIHAAATLMLALPKIGLLREPGLGACGELYLADIGVPSQVYERLGLTVPPLFARNSVVQIGVVDGKLVSREQ